MSLNGSNSLTASYVKDAGLLIQREECQIHRAETGQRDPDTVENIPIWVDSDVEVGGEDVVELSDLLVPEESVRHPDLADIRQSQVFDFICDEK